MQRRLAANPNAAFAVLDDGAVLLNVQTGRYFGLDEVATHLWKGLVDGASEPELLDSLVAAYDVEPDRARTDLTAFLQRLDRLGLLQTDDACPSAR